MRCWLLWHYLLMERPMERGPGSTERLRMRWQVGCDYELNQRRSSECIERWTRTTEGNPGGLSGTGWHELLDAWMS
jgi:hypothetical protein